MFLNACDRWNFSSEFSYSLMVDYSQGKIVSRDIWLHLFVCRIIELLHLC